MFINLNMVVWVMEMEKNKRILVLQEIKILKNKNSTKIVL